MAVAEQALELRKFVSPEFVLGLKARTLAGRYAHNLGGSKLLIVSDPGVAAAGWCEAVLESLEAQGLPYCLFNDVRPNPSAEQVHEGAEYFREQGCNLLLAVGGGSPIDCAKGIGIVSANGGDVLDYVGVDEVPAPCPPLICVPTTGSAADVSQFCILSDNASRTKVAILSKALVPDVSLIDPETMTTLPAEMTAHTAFDALTHAIEAYLSNASSPITDMFALEAIRLITTYLPASLADPTNLDLRHQLMLGSLDAGMAFSNAGLGIVHAMAHSLGGWLDLPHGMCISMLLDVGIAYNFPAVPERCLAIAEAMRLPVRAVDSRYGLSALRAEIDRLRNVAGIQKTLHQAGIRRGDIPALAQNAMDDACMATNPRWPTPHDIETLYEQAF
ncbi:MAG TPA: alcohol dehydrogenase-like regulatory protein ErcA [Stenomitos sp.]